MKRTFGQNLRELRRAKGISQRDLADQVSVDFTYISKLENDRMPPPAADTIVKICDVLGVPSDELLASTGKVPTQMKEILTSPSALTFMRHAHEMKITDGEWEKLTKRLKRLRSE